VPHRPRRATVFPARWRTLYETAARSAEVLALDVEDLDLPYRRAKVRVSIVNWIGVPVTMDPSAPPRRPVA
jgi:integrase